VSIAYAEEEADGYWWDKLDKVTKRFYISGFLAGHRLGEAQGDFKGYVDGMGNCFETLKSCNIDVNKNDCNKKTGLLIVKRLKEMQLVTYGINTNIADEIDAFYKTYPLCKSIRIDFMLQELIQAFRKTDKKSFKEIGEKCADYKE
jgi:hypothetical protein